MLLFLVLSVATAAEWHVPNAPVRFTLELTGKPTHKAAGYFVHLPDGGILPRSYPNTHVVSEAGELLQSGVLWHNAVGGLALVFAAPARGSRVHVYVSRGPRFNLWSPKSGIRPSAILCTDPSSGSMAAAQKLASLGSVGPTVHYDQIVGHKRVAFCIGGDLTGRPRPCAFYLLSHLTTSDPGKTWVAPFTINGVTKVQVNGQSLELYKRIDKWGGTGAYMDIHPELNRVEVFQTAGGTGGFDSKKTGGLMYLTWRTPKASMAELGGVRSNKVPMKGTSRMETRAIRNDEIARSGRCRVVAVSSRDGAALPLVKAQPKRLYWFGHETPIFLYELEALTQGNPDGTQYSWQFDSRGTTASGEKLTWLFPGRRDNSVQLTASSGNHRIKGLHSFYSWAPISSSLNDPQTRKDFFDASLTMFRVAPKDVNPMASFGKSYWNTLMRSVTIGEGIDVLELLLTERMPLLQKQIEASEIDLFEDIVLDAVSRREVSKAISWIKARRRQTSNRPSLNKLALAEADIRLHCLGESNTVTRLLVPLVRQTGEIAEVARIRLGDLAFVSGDLNRATALYADVQNRVRHQRNAGRSEEGKARDIPQSNAEILAQRKADRLANKSGAIGSGLTPRRDIGGGLPSRANAHVDNWKLTAFLGVSVSETVKSLIDQDQLLAARETLQAWERQFPLSKVSGDYILQEARYHIKLQNWIRARSMLEAYCDLVDASSYVPDASLALLKCMVEMKDSRDDIRAYCKKMSERLEFHPAGETFREKLWELDRK